MSFNALHKFSQNAEEVPVYSNTSYKWNSVATSDNGVIQTAVVYEGSIWRSVDSGATWSEVPGTSGENWQAVAMSANGSIQTAVVDAGAIWRSLDSGVTWLQITTSSLYWTSVAMSADGTI